MSLFAPHRYVASVDRIDLDELWAQGKRAIMLDRDNTLVPRDRKTAPQEVCDWLDRARELGFSLYMVSNNWHRDQVMRSAGELGLNAISHAMKPAPFAIKAALRRMGVAPHDAVLIGDQLYTDVWASMGQEGEKAVREAAFKGFCIDKKVLGAAGRLSAARRWMRMRFLRRAYPPRMSPSTTASTAAAMSTAYSPSVCEAK